MAETGRQSIRSERLPFCVITRAVIDDDNLVWRPCLAENGVEGFGKKAGAIIGGNDDADRKRHPVAGFLFEGCIFHA